MKSRSSSKSSKLSGFWSRRFSWPANPAKPTYFRNLVVNQTPIPGLPSLPFSEFVPIKHTLSDTKIMAENPCCPMHNAPENALTGIANYNCPLRPERQLILLTQMY